MQPSSINRSHKDRDIYDNRMPKVPNPEQFAKNPGSYYSKEDLKTIYDGIKLALGEQ